MYIFFISVRYYLNQKKTLEINPRHPLMKELLRRVDDGSADDAAVNIAKMMFRTGEKDSLELPSRNYWNY